MNSNHTMQRLALSGAALAMAFSFGGATRAASRLDPCTVVRDGNGLRPTAAPSNAVVTREQLVYDLCRASEKIMETQGKVPAQIEPRLRTIADEGRLIAACVTPRPSPGDDVTQVNHLAHHDFGCGPFSTTVALTTETPQDPAWRDAVCNRYIVGSPRPSAPPPPAIPAYKKMNPIAFTAHGPITFSQVAFDACYAAQFVSTSDAIDPEGRLSGEASRLLDKLEYEGYELNHCDSSKVPDQTDPDFANERNFSCGSYK